MPIIPSNVDPLKDYVTTGQDASLTIDGLVYNKIYAHTGVVDSLTTAQVNGYSDPNLSITNSANGLLTFDQQLQTDWISSQNFGGPGSAPVVNTYSFNVNTYYNYIKFFVLNVSCFVELGYYVNGMWTPLPGQSTFTILGGNNLTTTTDWFLLEYKAPYTLSTNVSNPTNQISLRITRQNNVVVYNSLGGSTNIAYSVGVKNFSIKLNVLQQSDIPSAVIAGTDTIISQNSFGFVESYSYSQYSQSNAFSTSGNSYWKSAPQPVGDAIVYLYAKVSDPAPSTINRLYLDPIYSNCTFNVYYTTQTTSGNTIDPGTFYWTPIQQDFILRKGTYEIPQTSCTYLKFEFTKLAAQPYDLPVDTINKTINTFPYDIEQLFSQLENNIINGNAVQYSLINNANLTTQTQVNNQISPSTIFGIASQTVANNNNWPSLAALNSSQAGNTVTQGINTASQITDPSISYKLLDSNGNYNNQSYSQFLQRKFNTTCVHSYNQITVPQSWHQAYFVGINYLSAFYESTYDELRTIPSTVLSYNGTNSGFYGQDTNYVSLISDAVALTPWFATIDAFTSFNIAGLTTDWQSFLTQGNPISLDNTLMNNLPNPLPQNMFYNTQSAISKVNTLGQSTVYAVSGTVSGVSYGIKSGSYNTSVNLLNYYDANFIVPSGSTSPWYAISGTTTVTGSTVTISGLPVNALTVSGGAYSAAYNFTLPNVYSASGIQPFTLSLGTYALGDIGYMTYSPLNGYQYYFLVNAVASGTENLSLYTRFINPTTNVPISGSLTRVNGSTVTTTPGVQVTITGTSYSASVPSNTLQVVVSGTAPYQLYQFGAFTQPTSSWTSSADRKNMRISGVARAYLPTTNNGTYQAELIGYDINNNPYIIGTKTYQPGSMPVRTWFDIEIEAYTSANYANFSMQLAQINTSVAETFYVAMLAPFYHPVRYEFTNLSGTNAISASGWYPITNGINNPNYFISTVSGVPASGIQVRMTALDSNVFISGVSVVPHYKQSPYYSNLVIDYLGNSKTNQTDVRTAIQDKPYFQLNKNYYPTVFSLSNVAPTVVGYYID